MAGSGGALNLSLLSRGVGEVSKNGHEKVEVLFEPQDYYNFRTFLPPIDPPEPTYAYDSSPTFSRRSHKPEIPIPKTFTTRKGALLLFSEDLAHKNPVPVVRRHNYHSLDETKFSSITPGDEDGNLKTVDDLAKSILLYGNQDSPDLDGGFMNMKFIRGRKKKDYFDRQIRPGFSAKRYLSSWTKSWDDSVLEKVISKGYLTEKSLFYYNPLMPHLQRRLNDDMSHYPVPYKLMRSMLMSPGSLSGYTFYRVRPESAETILTQEDAGVAISRGASIKVISTKDGIQREVTYASLDRHAKEEVLTDLLVKSAVHYAMKKQQEYMDGTYYSKGNKIIEVPESPVPKFDMQDAVESLLDGQKKKNLLDTEFIDDKSSEHSGSFKGKARRSKGSKGKRSLGSSRDDKEYIGNVPVVSMRAGDSSPTTLPPISGTMPLPPIGEASREQTNVPPVVLPPIGNDAVPLVSVQPPTPQHTFLSTQGAQEPSLNTQAEEDSQDMADGAWGMGDNDVLRQKAMDQERRRKEEKLRRRRGEGPTVSGGSYLQSSSESLGAGSASSVPVARPVRTHWKGSNQSLRSLGSKKGSGDDGSLKGSVIFGPDGQVISVGGAIQPSPRIEATGMIDQVTDANRFFGKDLVSDESDDEPDEWKHSKALRRRDVMRREGSVKSQISEEDIVNALTEHAQQVAASVLSSKPETGNDLEADVRQAAEMWMEKHPPRQISRSQSIQDNHDSFPWLIWCKLEFLTVIDEIIEIQKQKRKSAGPTAGHYRELIKDSLTTAMKAQGLNENIPDDTEISQEVIEALTNGSLTPDDLELVHDSDSGRSVIRSRSQMANAMGGVKEGHIYMAGSKKVEPPVDEFKKAVEVIEEQRSELEEEPKPPVQEEQKLPDEQKSDVSKKTDEKSTRSAKSRVSDKKSKVSDSTSQKGKSELEKRDEFVVGKPKDKKPKASPPLKKPKEKPKKGKGKGKAKKEEEKEPEPPPKEPTPPPPPPKEPTPPPPEVKSDVESERESIIDSYKSEEESDFEFNIVRDSPSPEPVPRSLPSLPSYDDNTETENEEDEEDDEAARLRQISNREARAAKRAAQAEKRRQEVDRRRRERDEQSKREKEEWERQELLKQELEEARKRNEENRRRRREAEAEENEKELQEEQKRQQAIQAEQERERRRREEYQRKLEEMKRKQILEEQRRHEEMMKKMKEEEERRIAEEEMMAKMAEEERLVYEEKKRREEEERKRKEEEERIRREEEAKKAMEEARKLAEEMARRQAELEARLKFNHTIQVESSGMTHSQSMTRAFVFSYYELLSWLGLDIPEFELLKLNQY